MHHRIRWPDGSLHWLEISGSLLPDKNGRPRMIGVIREITHQRQREQALSSSEKRFATLFHLCPNMVLLTRQVEPGQIVSAGSGVLFRMAKGGEMEMMAQLAEADLARVRVGTRATISPVASIVRVAVPGALGPT